MRKIAIYGRGGIGKSTTTSNIAAAFCAWFKRCRKKHTYQMHDRSAEAKLNEENMRHSFSVQVFIDTFEYEDIQHKSVVPLYLV